MPLNIREDTYALTGIMRASVTVGHPVKGNASLALEIIPPGQQEFSHTIRTQIPVFNHENSFMYRLEDIRPHTPRLAGTRLRVRARVQDWHGGDDTEATAVCTIYSRHVLFKILGGKVRTFKPGAMFTIQVAVYGTDGSAFNQTFRRHVAFVRLHTTRDGAVLSYPEHRVLIGDDAIARYSFLPSEQDQVIRVRVRYVAIGDAEPYQELVAHRHYTKSGGFIHIFSSTVDPMADEYMVFTVRTSTYVPEITYELLTSGNIATLGTLFMSSRQKTFSLALSRDMVPSARMLVYCVLDNGELLADSLSFHVEGVRNDEVDVFLNRGKDQSGDTGELIAQTEPSTLTLFLGAQYDAYHKGLHYFFSQHKVEEELMSYDNHTFGSFNHTFWEAERRKRTVHFAAPSLAIDPNTTFTQAGVIVITDAIVSRIQAAFDCNFTQGYLPCHDGGCYHKDRRCDLVRDCADGADELACLEPEEIRLPDVIKDQWLMEWNLDNADWLWKSHYTKPNGRIELPCQIPFRSDTWVIQAISLHPEKGLMFNESPYRVSTARTFYIEAEMPTSCVIGEQIGIQVTLFNWWHHPLESLLTLHAGEGWRFVMAEDNGVVSSYAPRLSSGDHMLMVWLEPMTTKLIYLPIVPIRKGRMQITVEGKAFCGSRRITHELNVKMDGVGSTYHTPYYIDLVNKGSQVLPDLDIIVPQLFKKPEERRHLYVPGSQRATVSLVGDVVGSGFFKDYLHSENMVGLKTGSGENYIFNFAANLYWLKYLETTEQLTPVDERKAIQALRRYLQNIMAYRMESGALSMWREDSLPCVWCTLFALRILNEATDPRREHQLYIDPNILDSMALWLADHQDKTTGMFSEIASIYDRKTRSRTNVTLTAYGVMAFHDNARLSGEAKRKGEIARGLAADYIANQIQDIKDPMEICVVTYALHLVGHIESGNAFHRMNELRFPGKVYWSRVEIPDIPEKVVDNVPYVQPKELSGGHGVGAQATAYALMVYLLNNRLVESEPIMRWLQTQRNTDHGFTSTQDTITCLQALSMFAFRDMNRGTYNMQLSFNPTSNATFRKILNLEKGKFTNYQAIELPTSSVWGSIRGSVSGTGRALFQLTTRYQVEFDDQIRKPPVKGFDLWVEDLRYSGRNGSRFDLNLCTIWRGAPPSSGYAVAIVAIPTGYWVHKRELELERRRTPLVKRARFIDQSVVLDLDHVPKDVKTCFHFYAFRWFPVANITIQHLMKINDFYAPEAGCQSLPYSSR